MSYAQVGSGALSGAAAGTAIMPGWGTAAGAVIGGIGGALSGDGGVANQQQQSRDALINAINQQRYSQGLNAEALKRSVAGSTDAQGSTIRYDPATNSWVSALGKAPQDQQAALNSANIQNNTTGVGQAAQNNAASSIQASLARRGMSGALNNLNNYTPVSQASLYGALQDSSTRANEISQNPIIADTLRQFARSGTAAGPVLSQLERANSDSLSQEMSQNVIKSMTGAADVNNANRQSLSTPITTLMGAGTPTQQNTAPSYTPGPASELAAQVNGRATGSASPATQGGAYSAYGTQATNAAAKNSSDVALNSNLPGELSSINQSVQSLGKSGVFSGIGSSINDWFNGGAVGSKIEQPDGLIYGPVNPNAPSGGTDMSAFMGTIPSNPNTPTNGWSAF